MNILKQFLIFLFIFSFTFLVAQEKSKVDTLVEGNLKMIVFYSKGKPIEKDIVYTDGCFYAHIFHTLYEIEQDSINIFTKSIQSNSVFDIDSVLFFYGNKPFNGIVSLFAHRSKGLMKQEPNKLEYDIFSYSRGRKFALAEIELVNGRVVKIFNYRQFWNGDLQYKTEAHFKNHKLQGEYKGKCINYPNTRFIYRVEEGKFAGFAIDKFDDEEWRLTYDGNELWKKVDTAYYYEKGKLNQIWIFDHVGVLKKVTVLEKKKIVVEVTFSTDSSNVFTYKAFYPNGKLKVEGTMNRPDIYYGTIELPYADMYCNYHYSSQGDTLVKDGLGKLTYYHPNGTIYFECAVNNGKLDGEYKQYTTSGNLLIYGQYVNGDKSGKWYVGNLEKVDFMEDSIYKASKQVADNERRWIGKINIEVSTYKNGEYKGRSVYFVKRK